MSKFTRDSLLYIAIILLVGFLLAWAGGDGGAQRGSLSVFAWCVLFAFVLNWIVFIPAYIFQTEHYFDATGTLTYLSLVGIGLSASGGGHWRAWLLAFLVSMWAIRLGTFLFARVKRAGSDGRFDKLKPNFARYLMVWSLQALWVSLTLAAALAAITSNGAGPIGWFTVIGVILFVAGFVIEVEADEQKSVFRSREENADQFIRTGLWAWSQHPNYFGEILLWFGIALIAWPALHGWQYVTLISPIFVYVLLVHISGIPLLDPRARRQWGDDADYQTYINNTPKLIPRPPTNPAQAGAAVD